MIHLSRSETRGGSAWRAGGRVRFRQLDKAEKWSSRSLEPDISISHFHFSAPRTVSLTVSLLPTLQKLLSKFYPLLLYPLPLGRTSFCSFHRIPSCFLFLYNLYFFLKNKSHTKNLTIISQTEPNLTTNIQL